MNSSIQAIESLGFEVKPDTLRTRELCMLVLPDSRPDVAVQLVANGSQFESFIDFRDALLQSPGLLSRYNALKLECTGKDSESYRDVKSVFIESALNAQ